MQAAVTDLVGRFTAPFTTDTGAPGTGRPFRLLVGCYPDQVSERSPCLGWAGGLAPARAAALEQRFQTALEKLADATLSLVR